MKNPLSYYTLLARRWAWVVILGIVICGGATFIVSKKEHPVYQASTTLIVNLAASQSAVGDFTGSVQAVPTYAQLLTSPSVLGSVTALHRGMTIQQLSAMITVKPQANTQLIELDVENSNPKLAMQLANEISQSFAQFSNAQLPATIQILPAQEPRAPIRPNVLQNTGIGALVGLGLGVALIVIFEWIDDRLANPEEVEELLDTESLAFIPHLSRKQLAQKTEAIPAFAEGCRMLATSLNMIQKVRPFKLLVVTSALAGEGKSTVAMGLASFLAMGGQRVLLVDANLSRPTVTHHFHFDNHPGLASAFMVPWTELEENLYGQPTDTPNLYVLAAGVLTSISTGLLHTSWVNHLFEHFTNASFDYVIFDTPPLLPVADTQVWAAYAQATVVVVDASKTPRKVLLRMKRTLNRTGSVIVGAVINKSRWTDRDELRGYVSGVQRKRADVSTVMTMPHRAIPVVKPPDTPSLNGSVENPDISVTRIVPRRPPIKDDQS